MRKTIIIIFLFFNICYAQEDTLKSYYPLSIGNFWQYKVTHFTSNDTTVAYKNTEVLKDTVMNGGFDIFYKLKAAFHEKPIFDDYNIRYLQYDSLSQSIVAYSKYSDHENGKDTLFKLNPNDNSSWQYFGYNVCRSISYENSLFGEEKSCIDFYNCDYSPPFWTYTLAKDIGPIKIVDDQSWGFLNYTTYNLVYAKIDGVEYGSFVTSINLKEQIPKHFSISQNYPNPFNPMTTINYVIPKTSHVSIKIYNAIGEEVEILVDEIQSAGNYAVIFNGKNLSSGVYYCHIKAGEYLETKKMSLIK